MSSNVAFVMVFDQPVLPREDELGCLSGRLVELKNDGRRAIVVSGRDYHDMLESANGQSLANRYVQRDLLALHEEDAGWSLVVYAFLVHEDVELEEIDFGVRDLTHGGHTVKNRVNLLLWKYYHGAARQDLRIIEGDDLAGIHWMDLRAVA